MKRWKLLVLAGGLAGVLILALAGTAWLLRRIYSEDATTSWTYRSPKYDFCMTLPSSDWQEFKKPDADVAFHNRKRSALAGVTVKQGDQDAFQNWVKRMQDYVESSKKEQLSEPQFTEGTTDSGDPFAYWTVQAKAGRDEAVFVAISLVWCKDKRLIVNVKLEGPLTMRSEVGKSAELDFYEKTARTLCLSVR
jgi:hypothetical protein